MHIRTGGRQLRGRGGGNLLNMGMNLLKAPGQMVSGLFKKDTWKNLFGFGQYGGRYAMPYGGRYGGMRYGGMKYGGMKYGGIKYGGKRCGGRRGCGIKKKKTKKHIR
jgi:hypothetical protein